MIPPKSTILAGTAVSGTERVHPEIMEQPGMATATEKNHSHAKPWTGHRSRRSCVHAFVLIGGQWESSSYAHLGRKIKFMTLGASKHVFPSPSFGHMNQ